MPWLNCGVTTQTEWPSKRMEVKYGDHVLLLLPPTKDTSASVHIDLSQSSRIDGLTIINRFLSALSWKCDEPAINHGGCNAEPNSHAYQKTIWD